MFLGRHYAHGAAAVAERDGPEPDVALGRVGRHEDLGAVEAWVFDAVLDMAEHRLAQREIRRRFQVQQARQDATVAAGVEHELGFDVVLAAVLPAHMQVVGFTAEIHADDGFAVTDVDALQRRLIGQQLVELAALHLEGGRFAVAERIAEIKRTVALAPGECGTGFHLETRGLHGVEHAGLFDKVDAVRQQAFTDRKAWEMLALDNQYIMPFTL